MENEIKNENESKKINLIKLILAIAAELFIVAAIVWFFDPFYQYHAPFLGLEAVLNDRDNQMPGTVRNFDYDSVLVGSSVAENFDGDFLDDIYGCRTLKLIRASGSMADLLYYLDMAQEEQNLKNVFWCLDIFALESSTQVTLYGEDIPRYLHTKAVYDDLPYLFNKEILLEKIPTMLAMAGQGINVGGNAYNWSRDKVFNADRAMLAYDRSGVAHGQEVEQIVSAALKQNTSDNIELLTAQIEAHPEITYRFMFPPYSMLWWDCAYVNGQLEERLYILEETLPVLLSFENVEVYFFQANEEIVCNLDNYMDMIHYSPEVSQSMLEKMAAGENKIAPEDCRETLDAIRELAFRITQEDIYRYYP